MAGSVTAAVGKVAETEPRWYQRPATFVLLGGAALWAWAGHALWVSTETAPIAGPQLEASRYFSSSFLERSATYGRFLEIESLLGMATLLVVLALYARHGHRLMRESAAGRIGTGMLLGMLGFGVVWLAEVPFGLVALWWQRRYDVSHQGYVPWLINSFLGLGTTFLFVCLALLVTMGLAGVMRRWWWAAAAPVLVAIGLAFTLVSPYLIPSTSPLRSPQLVADARALEREKGLSGTRLEVQDVHRFTTAPNAEAAGFGPSSTVVLWDTLLDGRFNRSEVRAVLGHELSHLAHHDPLKGLGWEALFLIPAWGLIALLTRRRGGMARPEAVPIALLVLVALQLLTTPFFNAVSRRQEAAADWGALVATREPAAARSLERKLAITSLSEPDPSGFSSFLFDNHPTAMERIAMTYAWEERSANGQQNLGSSHLP
ncbi:MAG TPA: M48 family metalloprotease [Solirubrobacterales bacterium]